MARILVDGYNLLLRAGRGADEAAREGLVRDALVYASYKTSDVTIVFDSRPGPGHVAATRMRGVRVVYANGEADDAIVELVRRSPTPSQVTVLTADRRLADRVRDLGGRVDSSPALKRKPRRSRAAPQTSPDKPATTSRSDIDYWLREFERSADASEDDWSDD